MEKIDEHCQKILMVLLITEEKIRFNKLHRKLIKYNAKMSKPTLIEHLKHLTKDKVIQRNEESKQEVSYEINWKRLVNLSKAKQISQDIYNHVQNEKTFKSMSLSDQTAFAIGILTISQLLYLKISIDNILKPKNKLQNYYTYTILNNIYTIYPKWLLDSCKKSKEDSQKAITVIDKVIKELLETLFKTPLKTQKS
jgi:DNA-binding HxlR family transcriptional regulator